MDGIYSFSEPDLKVKMPQSGGLWLAASWMAATQYDVRSTSATNLASSSKPLNLLEVQRFFLFLPKSHDLILHIKIFIRDEVIIMKKIEMPTGESKNFLEVIAVLGNDLSLQAFVSFSGYFLVDNFISHVRQPPF